MAKTVFRYDLRKTCAHFAFVDGGQWLTTAVFFGFYSANDFLVALGYSVDSNNTRTKADYVP